VDTFTKSFANNKHVSIFNTPSNQPGSVTDTSTSKG